MFVYAGILWIFNAKLILVVFEMSLELYGLCWWEFLWDVSI